MRPGDEVAGRYRLDELQGRGPMSEVWRAHDDTLDRTVALKILSPTADLDRFRREAQAVAALAHENVMRVYDYGEDEAGPFMALEWLPGGTLEERLRQGPLPPASAHGIAQGMAAGLAHLHSRGLVHRDLKPANVLFDEEERPKLADFGLVRHTAGSGTLTEAGTVLGTAAYISPEQASGEPAGPASDVYSFGVILFRMLTGALPFTADSALALVDMHRRAPPPAVETLEPDAPPELAALTAAALRKDPAQRPADGAALVAALGVAPATLGAADTQVTQVLPAPEQAAARPRGRTAVAIAAAIVLLAVGGGVLAWAVTRPDTTAPSGGPSIGTRSHSHTTTRATTGTTSHTHSTTQTTHSTTTSHQTTTHHTATSVSTPVTTATIPTTTPTTVPTTTTVPTVGTSTTGGGGTTATGTT